MFLLFSKVFRLKKRIAVVILTVWAAIFCLSFCDELGFWVDVGHAADQAVTQILSEPNAKLASVIDHTDHTKNGIDSNIVVVSSVLLHSKLNCPTAYFQTQVVTNGSPPLFQFLSRLLI